jgi:flagellar basal body-associated protein FliL
MEHEAELARIEKKIDGHIVVHEEDNKKLLWWIIGTLLTLILIGASGFVSLGSSQEKIATLQNNQKDFVTRAELTGAIALFNNKIDNLSEKIDRLINTR